VVHSVGERNPAITTMGCNKLTFFWIFTDAGFLPSTVVAECKAKTISKNGLKIRFGEF